MIKEDTLRLPVKSDIHVEAVHMCSQQGWSDQVIQSYRNTSQEVMAKQKDSVDVTAAWRI